ncbi:uncharacterized protein N7483_000959 [Penicillium malachiteum]|uniref:uncharacterized protein n=1 Tax=Penicillium malachiteum TaxID=1324776 RepID=UPI0025469305|nr:uncharacterized protein N7483_000959 [Penicillium malachiteum]KAJ5735834.1 hypothetical protein N7483_000959 [Penicillium malachiteum]
MHVTSDDGPANPANPAESSSMSNVNMDMMSALAVTNQPGVSTDVEMTDLDAPSIVNEPAAAPSALAMSNRAHVQRLIARNLLPQYGRARVQPNMNHATVHSNGPNGIVQHVNAIDSTAPNSLAQNPNGLIPTPQAPNSSGGNVMACGNFFHSQTNPPNAAITRNSSISTTDSPSGMGLVVNPRALAVGQHDTSSLPPSNLQHNNIQFAIQATNQRLNPTNRETNNNTGGANGINTSAFNTGVANPFSGGNPAIQSAQSSLSVVNQSSPAPLSNDNLTGRIQESNRNQANRGTPVPAIGIQGSASSQITQNVAYRAELIRVRTEALRNVLRSRGRHRDAENLTEAHLLAFLVRTARANRTQGPSGMLPVRSTPPVENHTQGPFIDHSDAVNVQVHNEMTAARARDAYNHSNAIAAARLQSASLLHQAQSHARTQGQGPGPGQPPSQNSIPNVLDSRRVGLPVGPNPPGQHNIEIVNTPNDFDRVFQEIEEQNEQLTAVGLHDVGPTPNVTNTRRRAPQLRSDAAALQAYLIRQQLIGGIPPSEVVPIRGRNSRQGPFGRGESRGAELTVMHVTRHNNGEVAITAPHYDPPRFDGDLGPIQRLPWLQNGTSRLGISSTGSSHSRPQVRSSNVSSTPNTGSTINQQNGAPMNLNRPSNNNQH